MSDLTMTQIELELQSTNFELIRANTRAAELSARKTRLEAELIKKKKERLV